MGLTDKEQEKEFEYNKRVQKGFLKKLKEKNILIKKIMESDDIMFNYKDKEIKKLKELLKNQKKLERQMGIQKGMIKILRFDIKELKESLKKKYIKKNTNARQDAPKEKEE